MLSPLNFQICQVVETNDPTQFDKYKDKEKDPEVDLPPNSIRIRIRGKETSGPAEAWAIPADPTQLNVPLYGEQVLVYSASDGEAEEFNNYRYFYMCLINAHGIVNNTILPFVQDAQVSGRSYSNDGISKVNPGAEPEQISFEEKDILPIQPFQGDIIRASRWGSILRFSATHVKLDKYKEEPFWKGDTMGDPCIFLTTEVKGLTDGYSGDPEAGAYDPYYKIEEPDDDKSFIYLTTKQKLERFELAQEGIGKDPEPDKLKDYDKSQVIIGSERLIFNAKLDELILVSAKDIKFCVPDWQIDGNKYWTQIIEPWLQICVDLAEGKERYATPAGATGKSSALEPLKKLMELLQEMKQ